MNWFRLVQIIFTALQIAAYFVFFYLGRRIGEQRAMARMAHIIGPTATLRDHDGNAAPSSEVRITFFGDASDPIGTSVMTIAGGHETSPQVSRDLSNMAIGALERYLSDPDNGVD